MTWAAYDVMADAATIPNAPGVYAFYFDGDLVYVGQSVNVCARVRAHKFRFGYARNVHTPWGVVPDSMPIVVKVSGSRRRGDWAMRELRLIHRLNPRHNVAHRLRLVA